MLRFTSTPTGDMTLENLREALFNYIVSKQRDENLIVRIEDTDTNKNIGNKDQEILDILDLFGIKYTQVIYQSQNIRFHTAMALELIHEKKAFSCFCSDDWLTKKYDEAKKNEKNYLYDDACRNLPDELVIDNTNPFRIRINKPDNTVVIQDIIIGDIEFKDNTLDSFIIMNQNKTAKYDFATAIDDMISDTSLVIHSQENTINAAKQDHIRNLLKYNKKIQYVHLPVIENSDAISVKSLLQDGYLPSSIANYLLLIGNKPPKEIFELEDAIEWFRLENISTSPTLFDLNLLQHINREHLKQLDDKELSRYVGFADSDIGKLAKVYLEQLSTTKELKQKIATIFSEKNIPKNYEEELNTLRLTIKNAPYFNDYKDFFNYVMTTSKLQSNNFSQLLKLLLLGDENGPDIEKIYKYLKNYIGEIIK